MPFIVVFRNDNENRAKFTQKISPSDSSKVHYMATWTADFQRLKNGGHREIFCYKSWQAVWKNDYFKSVEKIFAGCDYTVISFDFQKKI